MPESRAADVPEFLTTEWVAALDAIARATTDLVDAAPEPLVVEQQVVGPTGTVAYHLVLGPGPARVLPGAATAPDLTMVATDVAARRIHDGVANAQSCIADGTLRIRGNPDVLARGAAVLGRMGDLFATLRR